jgi:hypothetical protein
MHLYDCYFANGCHSRHGSIRWPRPFQTSENGTITGSRVHKEVLCSRAQEVLPPTDNAAIVQYPQVLNPLNLDPGKSIIPFYLIDRNSSPKACNISSAKQTSTRHYICCKHCSITSPQRSGQVPSKCPQHAPTAKNITQYQCGHTSTQKVVALNFIHRVYSTGCQHGACMCN